MEQNIQFERCIDFLAKMMEKYGDKLLREETENLTEKPKDNTDKSA